MNKNFYFSTYGTRKYYVSFHDGISKHSDGSEFYDMRIFKNKKDLNLFIHSLLSNGYKER